MKRLFTLFSLLLFAASCSKDLDVSQGGDTLGDAVSFTASVVNLDQSRGALKNSWSGDEQIALFISGESTARLFTVAADGTMSGDEIIVDREEEFTYRAFYPYDENLTTVADYKDAVAEGHNDCMYAEISTSGKYVDLQFTHQLAALSFSIAVEGAVTDPVICLALDGDLSNNPISLVVEQSFSGDTQLEAHYFLEEGANIGSAVLKLEYGDNFIIYNLEREGSSIVEVGKQYPFTL